MESEFAEPTTGEPAHLPPPLPEPDRRPAWWAWPLIWLVPVGLIAAQYLVPAAETEASQQQDLSLLAVLQFQSQLIIAMDGLQSAEARRQLASLENYATDDATTAALATVHGFIGLDDGGREAVDLMLARRREIPGADVAFLERVGSAIVEGVDEAGREALRGRLGWFANLPGVPGDPEAPPGGDQIRSRASVVVMLTGLAVMAAVVAIFTGAVLLLIATLRRVQGRLQVAFDPARQPAGVFLESFALFLVTMAVGNVGSWTLHWLVQPTVALGGLVLALCWPRLRGWGWRESRLALGWHRGRGVWREMAAGVTGYLAMLPLAVMGVAASAILMALAGLFDGLGAAPDGTAPAVEAAAAAQSPTPAPVTHPAVGWMLGGWTAKVAVFILAAIMAPLVEETFFRGAFFRSLRRNRGLLVSGLLNGLIFAALHPQGWLAIPALTAMGLGFALIREWRDSLIAPVVAHAINNGVLIGGLALVLQ